MAAEADNDVFLPDGSMVNQFLQELPSYQSLVRRRPSNYGTMESRKSSWRGRSLSRGLSQQESVETDLTTLPRELAISMQEKKELRVKQAQTFQSTTGFNQLKVNTRNLGRKVKDETSALLKNLWLWRSNIHDIEGKFGTGIGSYFSFLRFVVLLNFVIFLLLFCFTTLPLIISKLEVFNSTEVVSSTVDSVCSKYAQPNPTLKYFYTNIVDLLSGTGFLEMTYLFYGFYTIDSVTVYNFNYSLPLAYVLVTIVYLLLSIFWIVKRAVGGFKRSLVNDEQRLQSFCNKIFAGWDFCIKDQYYARLKHSSLLHEFKTDLAEERLRHKKQKRIRRETIKIYSLRFFLNIVVIGVLCGCFYAIYLATVYSQEHSNTLSMQQDDRLSLLIEYLPSIVITIANFITPIIFENIVRYEDYSPAFEIRFTLIRCVFVRLASIAVLLVSLWTKITSCSEEKCKHCKYNYEVYPCWETRVGQEMYKLMIFDFLIILAVILLVEFPRKLLVTYLSWKPVQWWGQQEFEIPQNVLELVYGQTICWIGAFYSPLLPAIATLKYFIIFYVKKITLMENCRPPSRLFRASSSTFFFLVILLIGLILACVPVGIGMAQVQASKACGPFINYNTSWEIIPHTVDQFPDGLKKTIYVLASESFAVPFFMVTCLVMFYFIALAGAHKKVVEQLQEQLAMCCYCGLSLVF
ncbi:transmembrane channel-like protein 7 isoform X2 [Engystomops pustulosus]|uniref:transmembrane channel-like protein 7 isoform X2 n=1 Tax=Engystomops pustulosus TaxID=76066 RepID=UPI003AFB817F